jgi:hypothetical protein
VPKREYVEPVEVGRYLWEYYRDALAAEDGAAIMAIVLGIKQNREPPQPAVWGALSASNRTAGERTLHEPPVSVHINRRCL